MLNRLRLCKIFVCGAERDKLLIHQVFKGDFPFPAVTQSHGCVDCRMANDNTAKGVVGMLNVLLIFQLGHGNSPLSKIMRKGGSTFCCRPLITYQQRQAGLSTAAQYAPFILTVDWLNWLCYFSIVIVIAKIPSEKAILKNTSSFSRIVPTET